MFSYAHPHKDTGRKGGRMVEGGGTETDERLEGFCWNDIWLHMWQAVLQPGQRKQQQQQIAAAVGIEKSNLSQVQTHTHRYTYTLIDNVQSGTRMPIAIVACPCLFPLSSPPLSCSFRALLPCANFDKLPQLPCVEKAKSRLPAICCLLSVWQCDSIWVGEIKINARQTLRLLGKSQWHWLKSRSTLSTG